MAGLCKALIIGNLGRDPEMRYTPSGKPVTSFSVAASRVYNTAEGERKEETEWFRVSAWGKLGEFCSQYLTKGRRVFVEGRLSSRTYTTQDGQKGFNLEITAADIVLLDSKPREGADVAPEEHASVGEDHIPF